MRLNSDSPDLRREVMEEWAGFIDRWAWNWFTTNTFRDEIHPEAAGKIWNLFIHKLNREIFGVRYTQRVGDGVIWVRGLEYQRRRVIHFHGLISRIPDFVRRLDWMDKWNELAGFSRILPYDPLRGARFYLSKYVLKGGQIDLGGPLQGAYQPFLELRPGCAELLSRRGRTG